MANDTDPAPQPPQSLCPRCGERAPGRWTLSTAGQLAFGLIALAAMLLLFLGTMHVPALQIMYARTGGELPEPLKLLATAGSALGVLLFFIPLALPFALILLVKGRAVREALLVAFTIFMLAVAGGAALLVFTVAWSDVVVARTRDGGQGPQPTP